jgi:CubicO group peptidase (beta-lactamase class C family)
MSQGSMRWLRVAALTALAGVAGTSAPRAAAQGVYWPAESWRRSSPEAQGMDAGVLADALEYIQAHHIPIHSLQIVRHGSLLLDAYFWPFANGQLHDLASVTKSVTSTLTGIAIGERRLTGVQEPVLAALGNPDVANPSAGKDQITIENLLTMTSGLDCHFDHGEITLTQMMGSANWVRFMLDRPMAASPGSHYEYCSGGMHVLSAVLARASGTSTLDFARRVLFSPLGIQEVAWPADPQGVQHGWGDLHLLPLDMARIGYLWLHDGRWADRQIVPSAWMAQAVRPHSHPGFSAGQEYGYGLWIYPERTPSVFEGLGRGGQRISVVPAADLVVVFTGGGFEPGDIGEIIGRALQSDVPLPVDTAADARLANLIREAAQPPAASITPALPTMASAVSGRVYSLDPNPLGLTSLELTFTGGPEGWLRLAGGDWITGPRRVGLDGVPRLTAGGRFGLPVAVSAGWEGDSTLVLDYDEVANIDRFRFSLRFSAGGAEVSVHLTERTGLMDTQFRGRVAER